MSKTIIQISSEGLSVQLTPQQLATLPDHKLLSLCCHYGSQALEWRQKFLRLLPEVNRRKLYEEKGCSSIFEFAAKVGGVSKEQVKLVLSLDQRFEFTPVLKQALVSGTVSVNKLARVVSVATPENQDFLAIQAQHLSQASLETLVRDSKLLRAQKPKTNKTVKKNHQRGRVPQSDELKLSEQMRGRLLAIQNKGINLEALLEEFLDQREEQIQQEKQAAAIELHIIGEQGSIQKSAGPHSAPSRYIPARVKRVLRQEYGEKCAQERCLNKATNIHHTRRFSLNPSHNPLYLAPLCKPHHEIAHSIDVKVVEKRKVLPHR